MSGAGLEHVPFATIETRAGTELERLIRRLPYCANADEALTAVECSFRSAFASPVAIICGEGDEMRVSHHTPGFIPGPEELERARSAMTRGRPACKRVNRECFYFVPLSTCKGAVGALIFATQDPISRRAWYLVRSFAAQASLTMLRSTLANQAQQASSLSEADRFQRTLLNSIAHNVRTPLASIIGVLSTLEEDDAALNVILRRELIDTARQEADRLNRLLGNLLDLSRIEARAVQVRADPCDVQDLIGAAIEQLGGKARDRCITVHMQPDLPLVRMDFVLIVQVLVNLLDNAIKYSSADTPIDVSASVSGDALEVWVEDCGKGIPEKDLCKIFDKFNRAGRTGETGGIGLGLSICKGLIEAHHGVIRAERRSPNGTAVWFRVPLRFGREE